MGLDVTCTDFVSVWASQSLLVWTRNIKYCEAAKWTLVAESVILSNKNGPLHFCQSDETNPAAGHWKIVGREPQTYIVLLWKRRDQKGFCISVSTWYPVLCCNIETEWTNTAKLLEFQSQHHTLLHMVTETCMQIRGDQDFRNSARSSDLIFKFKSTSLLLPHNEVLLSSKTDQKERPRDLRFVLGVRSFMPFHKIYDPIVSWISPVRSMLHACNLFCPCLNVFADWFTLTANDDLGMSLIPNLRFVTSNLSSEHGRSDSSLFSRAFPLWLHFVFQRMRMKLRDSRCFSPSVSICWNSNTPGRFGPIRCLGLYECTHVSNSVSVQHPAVVNEESTKVVLRSSRKGRHFFWVWFMNFAHFCLVWPAEVSSMWEKTLPIDNRSNILLVPEFGGAHESGGSGAVRQRRGDGRGWIHVRRSQNLGPRAGQK